MSNKKQTSVEWLVEQFNLQAYIPHIDQAKQLHKQEIMDAWYDGEANWDSGKNGNEYYKDSYETDN